MLKYIFYRNSSFKPTIVNTPLTTIAPVESLFTTFMDSLSKFNIFLDSETALLNLIYPINYPLSQN